MINEIINNTISLSCHEQAHLNILVHDMINLLYYEYWTDKQKYLYERIHDGVNNNPNSVITNMAKMKAKYLFSKYGWNTAYLSDYAKVKWL